LNFLSLFKRNLIYNLKKKISIDTDDIAVDSLDLLLNYYGSDKANVFAKDKKKGHGFSKFYETKLSGLKGKNINILEIGSYAGASAAAFAKYFSNSNIFCFDINISNFKYKSKKIHVFGIDINDEKKIKITLDKIFKQYDFEKFDFIIDDGSHLLSDILIGLKLFFKYVKKHGYFIIEDFKHPNYYEYNRNIDHIFIDAFLDNIKDKKFSSSSVINRNDQIDLIDSIKKIETFKGNLNDSDICFITKN